MRTLIRAPLDTSAHPCQICRREPAVHQYRSRSLEVGEGCVYRFKIRKEDLADLRMAKVECNVTVL